MPPGGVGRNTDITGVGFLKMDHCLNQSESFQLAEVDTAELQEFLSGTSFLPRPHRPRSAVSGLPLPPCRYGLCVWL